MQKDALKRLELTQMLFEKEMLENVEADVHLVATLMTLSRVIPDKTKDTARQVVKKVVDELIKKELAQPTQQAIIGSLNRSARNRRPKHNEINWHATIQKNLKHYQPKYKTIIPETRIGYGRKRSSLKDVVLCLDQSGSMGTSVVYSGIFGSVMASIPAIKTKMIVFDTAVAVYPHRRAYMILLNYYLVFSWAEVPILMRRLLIASKLLPNQLTQCLCLLLIYTKEEMRMACANEPLSLLPQAFR